MKFKAGDNVGIKRNNRHRGGAYAGMTGVVKYTIGSKWPYYIELSGIKYPVSFHANELELIGGDK